MKNRPENIRLPENLHLNAYYYSFEPTGERLVDEFLSTIASAGKAFHCTSQWQEGVFNNNLSYGGEISPQEAMQEMANRLALVISSLKDNLNLAVSVDTNNVSTKACASNTTNAL